MWLYLDLSTACSVWMSAKLVLHSGGWCLCVNKIFCSKTVIIASLIVRGVATAGVKQILSKTNCFGTITLIWSYTSEECLNCKVTLIDSKFSKSHFWFTSQQNYRINLSKVVSIFLMIWCSICSKQHWLIKRRGGKSSFTLIATCSPDHIHLLQDIISVYNQIGIPFIKYI